MSHAADAEPHASTSTTGTGGRNARALRRRLERLPLDAVLQDHPEVAAVLAEHGVDPHARCGHAVRAYLPLRAVPGRTCPVDDVEATWSDLILHVPCDLLTDPEA